jgi:UrcA family protein
MSTTNINLVIQERPMTTVISTLSNFRSALVLASAFAALTATTTSFAAAPADEVPSVTVRYNDLDLATSGGAATLYQRISQAARQVCPDPDMRNLAMNALAQRCRAEAIARAVDQLHSPQLALVHAAHASHG